jgi:hypothetical protein
MSVDKVGKKTQLHSKAVFYAKFENFFLTGNVKIYRGEVFF